MKTPMKERIFLFDNLKFFLIILVVMGHIIDPVINKSHFYQNLFTYIYLFHMPLFIFISGYFSKSFDKKYIKSYKIIQFIILYLSMRILEILITAILTGNPLNINILSTSSAPWYLLAVIIWMLTIPIIKNFNPKIMLPISIIIGMLAGFDNHIRDYLAISRVLIFYPFFLAGYYMKKDTLSKILNRDNTIFSILILTILALIIFNNQFDTYYFRKLLTGRNPYDMAGYGNYGIVYRFIYYIIVFIVIACILNITPRKKGIITKLGSRTLQVYFLHIFIYALLVNSEFYTWFITYIPYWKIILLLFSIIVTFILSIKVFEIPFRYLGRCRFKWLNKKEYSHH